MRDVDTSVPVVALKLFDHCGVGMMRSLGRLGVPVYGIDANPGNPAFSSRYCRGRFIWNAENPNPESTTSFLQEIAQRFQERPVLVTNGDVVSLFVAERLPELQKSFRVLLPEQRLARALSQKWQMFHFAREHGIPTPETLFPGSLREAKEYLDRRVFKFPIMLKGSNSALLEQRTGLRLALARSEREALEKYEEFADPVQPDLMLQEYIDGDDDSYWFFQGYFDAHSDCLIGLSGRKLRQSPAYAGMTSFGVLLKNAELEDSAKAFLKTIGYQGIVSIDYRFDKRDGQYKMLDVNIRIGANFRLFQDRQGLDVLRAYYLDLTGQPARQSEISVGRKWVVENNDLLIFNRYRKDGKITFFQWLLSFRGLKEGAWFAWDDPIPFLLMLRGMTAYFFRWLRLSRKQANSGLVHSQSHMLFRKQSRREDLTCSPSHEHHNAANPQIEKGDST